MNKGKYGRRERQKKKKIILFSTGVKYGRKEGQRC
jgi:hypothetical protein